LEIEHKNYMRLSRILLILAILLSMLSLHTALDAKKKKKEVEIKLYLDDAQLENPEYYNKLPVLSL